MKKRKFTRQFCVFNKLGLNLFIIIIIFFFRLFIFNHLNAFFQFFIYELALMFLVNTSGHTYLMLK